MNGRGYIYTETTHRKIIPGLLASNYFPPKNMHSKSKSPPENQRLVLFIISSPPVPSVKIWECIVISFLSVHAACLHTQRNCMEKKCLYTYLLEVVICLWAQMCFPEIFANMRF